MPRALEGGEDVLRQSWERGIAGCVASQPETGLGPEAQASSAHGVSATPCRGEEGPRDLKYRGPQKQASLLCVPFLGKTVQVTVEP